MMNSIKTQNTPTIIRTTIDLNKQTHLYLNGEPNVLCPT